MDQSVSYSGRSAICKGNETWLLVVGVALLKVCGPDARLRQQIVPSPRYVSEEYLGESTYTAKQVEKSIETGINPPERRPRSIYAALDQAAHGQC